MEGEESLQKEGIIGSLSHTCKVVRPGASFFCKLIDLTTTTSHLNHFICLTLEARYDFEWWHTFASSWNEVYMMQSVR